MHSDPLLVGWKWVSPDPASFGGGLRGSPHTLSPFFWGRSPHTPTPFWGVCGGLPTACLSFSPLSGKISYYTHPPETRGVQLEAQILPALGPALDLDALERGDAEALAGEKRGDSPFLHPGVNPQTHLPSPPQLSQRR